MDRALVERLHLELVDCIFDNTAAACDIARRIKNAVFRNHLSLKDSLNNDLKLGSARMDMRSIEAAPVQKSDCHT